MSDDIDARVLIRNNGLVLLVLEKEKPVEPLNGNSFIKQSKWGMPGGRNEPGDEDAIATAIRETKEETGMPVYVNEKLMVERDKGSHTKVVFVGYPADERIKINPEEILDCRWFPESVIYNEGFDMYFDQRQMAQELLEKLGQ